MHKIDAVARARSLVGTRFRAQGRDPRHGLDCVGLVLAVFNLPTNDVRSDYRIRGGHRAELLSGLGKWFRRVRPHEIRAGDVLLLAVSPDQDHLAVRTDESLVHADARLRRVVETPGVPAWPIVAGFRRRGRG